jgi:phosphatidate cytidylyltransferase
MKELLIRAISGAIYVLLLIGSLYTQQSTLVLLAIFGILSLAEFSKLIKLKSFIQYGIFIILFVGFWYISRWKKNLTGSDEAIQILLVITIFVNLILIKDLFTTKKIPLFEAKRFIATTFYLSSGFVFMLLMANYQTEFTP